MRIALKIEVTVDSASQPNTYSHTYDNPRHSSLPLELSISNITTLQQGTSRSYNPRSSSPTKS